MKKILFGCLLLLGCLRGVARNYYVAAVGNDQGDGSRAHPWRTRADAAEKGEAEYKDPGYRSRVPGNS